MATTTNTIDIKAGPDRVWAILSDLPATRQWLPGVVAARMDGDVRICQMADGQQVHKKITDVSAEQRSYRFEHVQVPLPVRHSGGTFTVTAGEDPDTATVTLRTTFEPADPAAAEHLTSMIHEAFQQSLASLRRYVESGRAWDAD